jgi:hypothetical protein
MTRHSLTPLCSTPRNRPVVRLRRGRRGLAHSSRWPPLALWALFVVVVAYSEVTLLILWW